MRYVPRRQQGCFFGCGSTGCVLMLAAALLPVASCFGGGHMQGYQALMALPAFGIQVPAAGLLLLYINAAAVIAFGMLVRARVSGGLVAAIVPAAPLALSALAGKPLAGIVVWAIGVALLIAGAVAMYISSLHVPDR